MNGIYIIKKSPDSLQVRAFSRNISKKMNVIALKFVNPNEYDKKTEEPGFVQKLKDLLFRRGR